MRQAYVRLAAIRETFHDQEEMRAFTVVDRDQTNAAGLGPASKALSI